MREHWRSRTGFILAAAGSAIGLGNIWRFPNKVAENGGGAFLIIYLGIVAIIGVSLMLAEIAMGRLAQSNGIRAYSQHFKGIGKVWASFGWVSILAAFLTLSFYFIVAGWSLNFTWDYLYAMITGAENYVPDFGAALSGNGTFLGWFTPLFWGLIFIVMTVIIVALGVNKGLEWSNKILMPLLLVFIVIVIFEALSLNTGLGDPMDGIAYYLKPDFSKVEGQFFDVASTALSHAFFSLSIGFLLMMTYGSYLDKGENLPRAAVTVAVADTVIAVLAGFMTLPIVFAFGMQTVDPVTGVETVNAGAGLVFVTLPKVFANLPYIFGFIFFALLTIAALTSNISIAEAVSSWFSETFKMSKFASVVIVYIAAFLVGILVSLSLGGHQLFGHDLTFAWPWMDKPADLLTSIDDEFSVKILIPLGGMGVCLFSAWAIWGKIKDEVQSGSSISSSVLQLWRILIGIIIPVLIAYIIISSFL
ncbi:MAG: sodium-dependent transporter [Alphaproteobacteria bacterium]